MIHSFFGDVPFLDRKALCIITVDCKANQQNNSNLPHIDCCHCGATLRRCCPPPYGSLCRWSQRREGAICTSHGACLQKTSSVVQGQVDGSKDQSRVLPPAQGQGSTLVVLWQETKKMLHRRTAPWSWEPESRATEAFAVLGPGLLLTLHALRSLRFI